MNDSNSQGEITATPPRDKRIKTPRTPFDTVIQKAMKRASDALENLHKRPKLDNFQHQDECSIFGNLVAAKLKTLNQRTQKVLMHEINNLIFKAEIAQIDSGNNTSMFHTHHTSQSLESTSNSLHSPNSSLQYVYLPSTNEEIPEVSATLVNYLKQIPNNI